MTVTDAQIDALLHALGAVPEDRPVVRRWVDAISTGTICEHGIPRRFCTALHAETVTGDPR